MSDAASRSEQAMFDSSAARRRPVSELPRLGYQSEPGVLGRPIPVPRAKVIGGSTAHNGAVASRGTPEDYDEWSRLGSPGWSFEQLLDDFRRLEDDPEGDVRYHGRGGPVPIRRYTDRLTLLHRSFIRTATQAAFGGSRM
jgi:choline dehydrogenase